MAHIHSQDASQIPSADLPWLTFSGSPTEVATDFIQSVQRVAFQQRRLNDDLWLTEYVSTCFGGDALLWYSSLDDDTRNSWSKLRNMFLQRYSQAARPASPSLASPTLPLIPVPSGATTPPPAASSPRSPSHVRRGRIEVFLHEHATTLGFIAYNSDLETFSIVRDMSEAQVISFTKDPNSTPFHIRMEDTPVGTQYPYVGLAVWDGGRDSYVIPPPLQVKLFGSLDPIRPSSACSKKPGWIIGDRPIATWALRACTESSGLPRRRRAAKTTSSGERASSAIWKHDQSSDELSIFWLMDNDKEEELRALVPEVDGEDRPEGFHVHRLQDWNKARSRFNEKEIGLYFVPEESN